MQSFFNEIASKHGLKLNSVQALSGGDINEVYRLKTSSGSLVLKINDRLSCPGMFEAEARGLQLLLTSHSFMIPEVVSVGAFNNRTYLLMEYVPSGSRDDTFWHRFAEGLVKLHGSSSDKFGLDHDNFIGSLLQQNEYCSSASEFYILRRLEPQFKLASERGYSFGDLDAFYKSITGIIPTEAPALIHGDLWAGNFMVSGEGRPVLIDPAVSYASREMDLAMMRLFGGFPKEVFEGYNELFPLVKEWEQRISLWQLYYLLVHLNLFGSGYLAQVRRAMATYL